MKVSSIFVAFLENMNFTKLIVYCTNDSRVSKYKVALILLISDLSRLKDLAPSPSTTIQEGGIPSEKNLIVGCIFLPSLRDIGICRCMDVEQTHKCLLLIMGPHVFQIKLF